MRLLCNVTKIKWNYGKFEYGSSDERGDELYQRRGKMGFDRGYVVLGRRFEFRSRRVIKK